MQRTALRHRSCCLMVEQGNCEHNAATHATHTQRRSPDRGRSEARRRFLAVLTAAAASEETPSFRFSPPLAAVDAVAKPRRLTVLCCTEMSAADLRRLRLVCT
jgi:hypothetical protein